MPYYSELGLYTTPSTTYSTGFLKGPYSNHSSILASNILPPSSKSFNRSNFRGFKPHLTTISETSANSPLRRINSPKLLYHTSPKVKIQRPLKINTADIDVSVNKYRRYDRSPKTKPESLEKPLESRPATTVRETKSPESKLASPPESIGEKEAVPNTNIRRDRATVRLQTIHRDAVSREIGEIKSWRDNFKPEELVTEAKVRRKTPGEILKEKFLIRSKSKENVPQLAIPNITRKKSVRKSPSFKDICDVITSDSIVEDLNPGQPVEVKRRQSRQISGDLINEIRRNSSTLSAEDVEILDVLLSAQEAACDLQLNKETQQGKTKYDAGANAKKKKVAKKRPTEKLVPDEKNTYKESPEVKLNKCESNEDIMANRFEIGDENIKTPVEKRSTQRKTSRVSVKSPSEYVIKDISQVEIETIPFKQKPIITSSVGHIDEQIKTNLKAVIDDVKVEEVVKPKKEKKFRFNVTVEEIEEKRRSKKVPSRKQNAKKVILGDEEKVIIPKAQSPVVLSILKKNNQKNIGHVLSDIEELTKEEAEQRKTKNQQSEDNIVDPIHSNKQEVEERVLQKSQSNESVNSKPPVGVVKTKSCDNMLSDEHNNVVSTEPIKNICSNLSKDINNIERNSENCKSILNKPSWLDKNNEELKKTEPPWLTRNKEENISLSNKLPWLNKNKDKHKEPDESAKTKKAISPTVEEREKTDHMREDQSDKLYLDVKEESSNCLFADSKNNTEDTLKSDEYEENNKELIISEKRKEEDTSTTSQNDAKVDLNKTELKTKAVPKSSAKVRKEEKVKKAINENKTTDTSEVEKPANDSSEARNSIAKVKNPINLGIISESSNESLKDELKPTNNNDINAPEEGKSDDEKEEIRRKLISKRSLIQKANKDDPDLVVFEAPPEPEPEPEPEPVTSSFVPLQSNRISAWMHPWKKPDQLADGQVEIFAKPKYIRGRHIPRRWRNSAYYQQQNESESSSSDGDSSEDETSSSDEEETSSDEEESVEAKIGASTSSNDSGFDSGRAQADKNKGSLDSRDSPASNPALNPAFALDSNDIPEEYSTSSTYAGFQKSGRITPPATTIPRFRKYCLDDFNFLKVLGKGSFGKVLLAELKGTEYYYAIKCLKKDVVLEDDDVECTLIERKVLALGTKHPYLCHLLCTFQTESHLFFVMEYLNGGDLMFHIQLERRFSEARARFYGAEIVSGLKFLHNKGIVYRDLKLDNILLDFDGHVRIADFGMCKLQIFLDRMADTFCGTPDYMAPEIIKGQHYNQCVDWWSFGVLLYEMLLGQSPFSGCDEDELFWSICNEKPVIPKFLSQEANLALTQFLDKDSNKRLGNRFSPYGDIQDHIFFRPIDWVALEARQLEPPFKPNLQHPLDTQYFDKTFTVEKAKLTPIETTILQSMDQTQFQGFSYTNPNATDK